MKMKKGMKTVDSTLKKIGLVLAGGGGKGAYQIGCWKALEELGIEIKEVSGTSVGGLNAALFTSGDLKKAENLWSNISRHMVFSIKSKNIFSLIIRLLFILGLPFFKKASWDRYKIRLRNYWAITISSAMGFTIFYGVMENLPKFLQYRGWYSYIIFFFSYIFIMFLWFFLWDWPKLGWFLCEKKNIFTLSNKPLEKTISNYIKFSKVKKMRFTCMPSTYNTDFYQSYLLPNARSI